MTFFVRVSRGVLAISSEFRRLPHPEVWVECGPMSLVLVFLSWASFLWTQAAETDSFTPRNQAVLEGLAEISDEVDRRIERGIRNANAMSSCNTTVLEVTLGAELLRPFYGRIEDYANVSLQVAKIRTPFDQSIYRRVPELNFRLLQIGETIFGFGTMIRRGEHLIGTDKFGHFFDEGHFLYLLLKDDGSNLEDVLYASELTETGLNGLAVGGIKSYADLVANYQGLLFWTAMLKPKLASAGKNPYVRCEKGQWMRKRTFDFKDYVDGAWDEAINCNQYATDAFGQSVHQSLLQLRTTEGEKLQCPLPSLDCPEILRRYKMYARYLLHPATCRTQERGSGHPILMLEN